MTLFEFILMGVAPFVFLVVFLSHAETMIDRLSKFRGNRMKKKALKAVFGLGGAFIVLSFWAQLAQQAKS